MKTLKKKVNKTNTRTKKIISNEFLKRISKEIYIKNRIKYGLNGKYPKWKNLKQSGGEIIEEDGYQFLYSDDGETIICSTRKALCFKIDFSLGDKEISIDISYSSDCSINKELPRGEGTIAMLKAIFKLIFTHKNIKLYEKITLSDNSEFKCHNKYSKKNPVSEISLVNTRFIATGCSWYSTFAPMFLYSRKEEMQYLFDKNIVTNMLWGEFYNKLSDKTRKFIDAVFNFGEDDISDVKACKVIDTIRKDKDACGFFAFFLGDLMKAFGIESQSNKKWCIPLRNGKIIYCKEVNDCFTNNGLIPQILIENVSCDDYNIIKSKIQKDDLIEPPIIENTPQKKYSIERN
jgi:hypothetical protein